MTKKYEDTEHFSLLEEGSNKRVGWAKCKYLIVGGLNKPGWDAKKGGKGYTIIIIALPLMCLNLCSEL